MQPLIAITIAVFVVAAGIVARRRRAPSHVVERLLRRVGVTVPAYQREEARVVRAVFTEQLEDEKTHRQKLSDLAQAARERTANMDSAERIFGASRKFYGFGFAVADFAGQSAVNWITFAQRDTVGLVVTAAAWTAGPAFVSAFLAEGALTMFGRRRPDSVRQALDVAAWTLGVASLGSQLVIMVSRAAGFDLGPIEDVLPVVMNVVASAGGIASGLLLGVERHLHAEARFNKEVASSDRAIRIYGEGLVRLDEIVPPLASRQVTSACEPFVPTSSAVPSSQDVVAGNGHEPVEPVVPPGVPSSRSGFVRSMGMTLLALGISSATLSAQPLRGCAQSYDASLSSSVPEMSEAQRRVVESTPSFLNRFCTDGGGLYVRRFGGDTLWQQQRHFVVPSMPAEFRHCAKAQPSPARNRYAQIRRETIRGVAEGATRLAVRTCTAMAESIGNAVQRDRQALRDSVARMLKTSTPIRNENRSAIADQITQAIGRRYAAIVIVTDLIENVRTEIDSIRVPEGMTVVLVLVPAADAYGGADATARWATIFTDRVKGIYVLPYTELDSSDFWTASPHFMQRVSGPSG